MVILHTLKGDCVELVSWHLGTWLLEYRRGELEWPPSPALYLDLCFWAWWVFGLGVREVSLLIYQLLSQSLVRPSHRLHLGRWCMCADSWSTSRVKYLSFAFIFLFFFSFCVVLVLASVPFSSSYLRETSLFHFLFWELDYIRLWVIESFSFLTLDRACLLWVVYRLDSTWGTTRLVALSTFSSCWVRYHRCRYAFSLPWGSAWYAHWNPVQNLLLALHGVCVR